MLAAAGNDQVKQQKAREITPMVAMPTAAATASSKLDNGTMVEREGMTATRWEKKSRRCYRFRYCSAFNKATNLEFRVLSGVISRFYRE